MSSQEVIEQTIKQLEGGGSFFRFALISYSEYNKMLSGLKRRNVVNRMYKAGKNKVK